MRPLHDQDWFIHEDGSATILPPYDHVVSWINHVIMDNKAGDNREILLYL